MELNEKQTKLLDKLNELPPSLDKISRLISEGDYSKDDISLVGAKFVDGCTSIDDGSMPLSQYFPVEPHAPYLYEILKLLLEKGLDPNAVYEGINIMQELLYISTPYVAADCLALLLENGCDLDLEVDGWRFFDDLDFDVIFDAFNQEARVCYDSLVHCWFVALGFGGRLRDGSIPVDVFDIYDEDYIKKRPFDLALLKDHQNYTFGISNVPWRGESYSIHIFDKRTFYEVARM